MIGTIQEGFVDKIYLLFSVSDFGTAFLFDRACMHDGCNYTILFSFCLSLECGRGAMDDNVLCVCPFAPFFSLNIFFYHFDLLFDPFLFSVFIL